MLAAPGSVAAAGPAAPGPAAVAASTAAVGSSVLDGRNADSNDYLNADGRNTVRLFGEPVNYRTGSGEWRPCECDLVLTCSKFLTTSDYTRRLRGRLEIEQQLIEDATTGGWHKEVERHTATKNRINSLLKDLCTNQSDEEAP